MNAEAAEAELAEIAMTEEIVHDDTGFASIIAAGREVGRVYPLEFGLLHEAIYVPGKETVKIICRQEGRAVGLGGAETWVSAASPAVPACPALATPAPASPASAAALAAVPASSTLLATNGAVTTLNTTFPAARPGSFFHSSQASRLLPKLSQAPRIPG